LLQARYGRTMIHCITGGTGLCLGLLIEFFQAFSPSRTGDLTDALLFCFGGVLGSFSLFYFIRIRKSA
jgi:VanZ family protein